MKKRIKTNCNYTLKPETHSFLGEKGKDIIFSGSGYAECEGTNAIIVNRNEYYNNDDVYFNNNSFGVGSAMNKRLRCNTFSFQIRNKNLYGADLLNLRADENNDWFPTTLTADPATGAVHWVAPEYTFGDSGTLYLITFFNENDSPKTFHLGNTNKVYFSCLAKGLKYNANIAMRLGYNNHYSGDMFFSLEKNNSIMNVPLTEITDGNLILQSLELVADYVAKNVNFDNSQDVWFYPVISTEPITEEFFDNYVGYVPFPNLGNDITDISVAPQSSKKCGYALSYEFDEPYAVINGIQIDGYNEFLWDLFPCYFAGTQQRKGNNWIFKDLKDYNENYLYQWVWNTINTGIMGNAWASDEAIVESLIDSPQVYKPLFMLGYHHGAVSLITTGEKMPTFPQDADQEICPVIQTLVFVNYEAQVPDYISPVYTIVYPTLVNAD